MAARAAASNGVSRSGTSSRRLSSRATVALRNPSISGRATRDCTGVTSTSQYDESRGVRTGTSTINGRLPRIRAMPSIISRYVMTSGPPASNVRPSISSWPAAAAR